MASNRFVTLNADEIKWQMDIRDWSHRDLAEAVGMSESSISHLLHRKRCKISTRARLARAFSEFPEDPKLKDILIKEGLVPPGVKAGVEVNGA